VPKKCYLVLDVRFLTNPHFVPELRHHSGKDREVASFLTADPKTIEYLNKTLDYLKFLIPHYAAEGKSYLTIGIGCTGGKHRSVFVAEELSKRLQESPSKDFSVSVEHQDLRS